jgi:hypothetical protein
MIDTYCLYVWYCKEDPVNPTGAAAAEASSPSDDLASDWVARFAEAWRAPDGPHFDPPPLLLALARTPRVWPRLLRLSVAPLVNRIRWRKRP